MKMGTSIPGAHPEPLNTSDSPGTRALLLSTRRDSGPDDTVDVDVDADVDGRTMTGLGPKGFAGGTGGTGATVDGPVMTGVGPKGSPPGPAASAGAASSTTATPASAAASKNDFTWSAIPSVPYGGRQDKR